MLGHLRAKAEQALADAHTVMLVSCGPAGPQVDSVLCQSDDLRLYLLVLRTSDQLLNLEESTTVVLNNKDWKLRGTARILPAAEIPTHLSLASERQAAWSAWVQVRPLQLQCLDENGNPVETIDFQILSGG